MPKKQEAEIPEADGIVETVAMDLQKNSSQMKVCRLWGAVEENRTA